MQKLKPLQIAVMTLLSMVIIFLLRTGGDGDSGYSVVRELPPLVWAEQKETVNWNPKPLRERLLVFVPEKKGPTLAEQQAAQRAAELARKAAIIEAAKPPPVDKTIKPMFSQLDDDHQVGLMAVIESDAVRTVVLQRINFASKENQNIKLQDAGTFDGWTVTVESQTRVVLNKSERKIYLNLFKPGNI